MSVPVRREHGKVVGSRNPERTTADDIRMLRFSNVVLRCPRTGGCCPNPMRCNKGCRK